MTEGMVRESDPGASHDAAVKVSKKQRLIQVRTLNLFRAHGDMTDGQLVERYREMFGVTPESTPRKRRTELTDKGFIVDSGRHTPRHFAEVPTRDAPLVRRSGNALFRVIWKLAPCFATTDAFDALIEHVATGTPYDNERAAT